MSIASIESRKLTDLFSLAGKTALITGSSQGIGYALAKGLAGAGATIILNGRNKEKLEQAAKTLRESNATVETCVFDVTDHQGKTITNQHCQRVSCL